MLFLLKDCCEALIKELPEYPQYWTPANRKSCRFHPIFVVVPLFDRPTIKWSLSNPWKMFSETLCYQFEVEILSSKCNHSKLLKKELLTFL